MNDDKIFKILSIDGGGVHGVFAIKILELMEENFNIKIFDYFDLIVGTSTGSITAGAISTDYKLSDLLDDYQKEASSIFKEKKFNLWGCCKSKYDNKILQKFLQDKLGNIKLKDIEKPLILNATNVSLGDIYIFKSVYQKKQRRGDYVRDGDTPLYKAVLASCAAPTYFDPVDINGTLVCDGGIWANNPALVGYTDAINNFKKHSNCIRILSLGSGQNRKCYQMQKRWGFLSGWETTKLVDFMMSCQTRFPSNVLSLIDKKITFRINPFIDNYGLDEYKFIPTLIEIAKKEFTKHNTKIQNFLKIGGITK